ncbi:MAG: hypothetical protein AAF560_32670 [Acidobacteriota bacterium]
MTAKHKGRRTQIPGVSDAKTTAGDGGEAFPPPEPPSEPDEPETEVLIDEGDPYPVPGSGIR